MKLSFLFVFCSLSYGALIGCTTNKGHAFKQVELCVQNEDGVRAFKNTLKGIASSKSMSYIDGATSFSESINDIRGKDSVDSKDVIYIGVEGKDGLGLTAGNLGLAKYQIAIGYTAGRSESEALQFERDVNSKLIENWDVKEIPDGSSALPDRSCGNPAFEFKHK